MNNIISSLHYKTLCGSHEESFDEFDHLFVIFQDKPILLFPLLIPVFPVFRSPFLVPVPTHFVIIDNHAQPYASRHAVASTIATRIGLSLGLQGLQIIYVDQINDSSSSSYLRDELVTNVWVVVATPHLQRDAPSTPTRPRTRCEHTAYRSDSYITPLYPTPPEGRPQHPHPPPHTLHSEHAQRSWHGEMSVETVTNQLT